MRPPLRAVLRQTALRAMDDRIFLLAGALTHNLILAFIPLLVVAVGITGFVLQARFGDPAGFVLELILRTLPPLGAEVELVPWVRARIEELLRDRGGISLFGGLVFLWFATRVVSTLRQVLAQIFDIPEPRGILHGKLFDAFFVLAGGVLLSLNLVITVLLEGIRVAGIDRMGLPEGWAAWSGAFLARAVALGSVWALFGALYRWVPSRPTPWKTVVIASSFTAIGFEFSKIAFGIYITRIADYGSIYGNLATLAILLVWIQSGAIVFILGGEFGHIWAEWDAMHEGVRDRTDREGAGSPKGGTPPRVLPLLIPALALIRAAVLPAALDGQSAAALPVGPGGEAPVRFEAAWHEEPLLLPAAPIAHEGAWVLVHVARNRVYLMDGGRSIWSAPAGTGTGFRLSGAGQDWAFDTPRGFFRILRKEKDPIWEAPDWYYVERGVRPPPPDHPSRRIPGVMGNTALYLGDGIAIHGTNAPGLLLDPDPERRRVSHGCIRLTNEAARELFHEVDVGTPVLVF